MCCLIKPPPPVQSPTRKLPAKHIPTEVLTAVLAVALGQVGVRPEVVSAVVKGSIIDAQAGRIPEPHYDLVLAALESATFA